MCYPQASGYKSSCSPLCWGILARYWLPCQWAPKGVDRVTLAAIENAGVWHVDAPGPAVVLKAEATNSEWAQARPDYSDGAASDDQIHIVMLAWALTRRSEHHRTKVAKTSSLAWSQLCLFEPEFLSARIRVKKRCTRAMTKRAWLSCPSNDSIASFRIPRVAMVASRDPSHTPTLLIRGEGGDQQASRVEELTENNLGFFGWSHGWTCPLGRWVQVKLCVSPIGSAAGNGISGPSRIGSGVTGWSGLLRVSGFNLTHINWSHLPDLSRAWRSSATSPGLVTHQR